MPEETKISLYYHCKYQGKSSNSLRIKKMIKVTSTYFMICVKGTPMRSGRVTQ